MVRTSNGDEAVLIHLRPDTKCSQPKQKQAPPTSPCVSHQLAVPQTPAYRPSPVTSFSIGRLWSGAGVH